MKKKDKIYHENKQKESLFSKVITIRRVSKVVKGGRRFGFAALVVSGDKINKVGIGYGKAKEVPEAIKKATEISKKNLNTIVLKNNTIPHKITMKFDGSNIFMKPAALGTGIISGGGSRAVFIAAGIKDVLSKSLGSNNPISLVKATLKALLSFKSLNQNTNK